MVYYIPKCRILGTFNINIKDLTFKSRKSWFKRLINVFIWYNKRLNNVYIYSNRKNGVPIIQITEIRYYKIKIK